MPTVAELEAKLTLNIADFQASLSRLDSMVSGSVVTVTKLAAAFAGAQVGLESLGAAFEAVKGAVLDFNSTMERATITFTYFLGGADQAREHIKALMAQAEATPFPVEQFLNASRALQGMGMAAAFVPGVLKQIADAAAVAQVPLDTAAQAIGRFLSMVAGGQGQGVGGVGQGARALMSMGLITGPMLAQIRSMEAAGASAQQVIDTFLASLGKFSGAAEAAANTWSGLVVRIKDTLSTELGQAFQPLFAALEELAKRMKAALDTQTFREGLQGFVVWLINSLEQVTLATMKVYQVTKQMWDQFANLPIVQQGQTIAGQVGNALEARRRGIGLGQLAFMNDQDVIKWLQEHGGLPQGQSWSGMLGGAPEGAGGVTDFFGGLRTAAGKVPAGPGAAAATAGATGPMFQPVPPSPQQLQTLEQAIRLYADLNPLTTASEAKTLQLAKAYDELILRAGPFTTAIKQIRDQAVALNLQFEIEKEQLAALTKFQMQQFTTVVARTMPEVAIEQGGAAKLQGITDSQTLGALEQAQQRVRVLTDMVNALTDVMGKNSAEVANWQNRLSDAREALQQLQTVGLTAAANVNTMVVADEAAAIAERNLRMASEEVDAALGRLGYEATIMGSGFDQAAARVKILQDALRAAATGAIPQTEDAIARMTAELKSNQGLVEFKSYIDDVFSGLRTAMDSTVRGLTQGTLTMSQAFNNLGQSILITIEETLIKHAFTNLEKSFSDMLDSMDIRAAASTALKFLGSLFGATPAAPAAPAAEPIAMQSGGLVTRPTFALVGEHGPEAVIPLDHLQAGGGGGVNITVINNSDSNVQAQDNGTSPNGQRQIKILVESAVQEGLVAGRFDRTLGSIFGLNRQGVGR